MGRSFLYAGETIAMQTAETIFYGYHQMIRSPNRAKWMEENKILAQLLYELEQLNG